MPNFTFLICNHLTSRCSFDQLGAKFWNDKQDKKGKTDKEEQLNREMWRANKWIKIHFVMKHGFSTGSTKKKPWIELIRTKNFLCWILKQESEEKILILSGNTRREYKLLNENKLERFITCTHTVISWSYISMVIYTSIL